jgi:heat-inducible transcriptional repressor
MRILNPETQENRKRKLLQAVIYQYVRTAKPVGSQVIVDKYNFGLSSATVRNLLVDLEKEGFLIQPHTSAGRVPTDKGYRFYVDSLLEIQTLASAEEERIRKEYQARSKELEGMMLSTSHMLSALSHYTGLILSPRLDKTLIRRLQLISLGGNQILVVVVSQSGLIRHRVVTLNRPISSERLTSISSVLNDKLQGLPLSEVRTQILDHIEAAEQEHAEVFSLAKDLARDAFDLNKEEHQLYVDGKENIVDFPEFNDYRQLSSLLKVVEEKNLLTSILENEMKKGGLTVKIGSENKRPELRGISLVSSTYKIGENAVGVLGILGPRRMEYARMISLVEGVTRIVNQMLTRYNEDPE